MFKLSVIIPNHNYGRFVGAAIESALMLDWPDIEVIVVDDGSTDCSVDIIRTYADQNKVKAIFQENKGQAQACLAGFEICSGYLIIFLDSDDILLPELLREVGKVLDDNTSKIQCQMQTIDDEGNVSGGIFPKFSRGISPIKIRRWFLKSSAYPTPPGSGNVYSRKFVEKLLPIDTSIDRAMDSYLLSTAPILGDVVTIAKPLVLYRVHSKNQGAMNSLNVLRFSFELGRSVRRTQYAADVAALVGLKMNPRCYGRSLTASTYRISSLVLTPNMHPVVGDCRLNLSWKLVYGLLTPQGNSISSQFLIFIWAASILWSPVFLARLLVRWRYVPSSRPRALARFIYWKN